MFPMLMDLKEAGVLLTRIQLVILTANGCLCSRLREDVFDKREGCFFFFFCEHDANDRAVENS